MIGNHPGEKSQPHLVPNTVRRVLVATAQADRPVAIMRRGGAESGLSIGVTENPLFLMMERTHEHSHEGHGPMRHAVREWRNDTIEEVVTGESGWLRWKIVLGCVPNRQVVSKISGCLDLTGRSRYCRKQKVTCMPINEASRPFAVVTGASRGIGAEYARALAARGYEMLLVSRDGTRLAELGASLGTQYGVDVAWETIDLAKSGAGHQLYAAARQRRPAVDILVNNAGFGLYGPFVDMPLTRLEEMLTLHVCTVVQTTRLFLPSMIDRGRGAIINVSSIAGLFSVPYLAQYAATKAFLVAFSEAIAQETRKAGVRIQVCCPGYTKTDFHARAGFPSRDPLSSDSPSQVVGASLAALERSSSFVTVGMKGGILAMMSRCIPRRLLLRISTVLMKPKV